jgi:hypothetical protein
VGKVGGAGWIKVKAEIGLLLKRNLTSARNENTEFLVFTSPGVEFDS